MVFLRRPASPITILVLVAIGAFSVGFGGTGAYLAVSRTLSNQTTTGLDDPGSPSAPAVEETTTAAPLPCPQFTADAVRQSGGPGNLVELRWVQGARPGGLGGEAWICRDDDGRLYYQGHDLTGPATAATSSNTILIGGSVRGEVFLDGDIYVATNGQTRYLVGPDVFAIVNNGNRTDFTDLIQRP